MIMSLLLSR